VAQIRPDPWWGLGLATTNVVSGTAAPAAGSRQFCANPECPSPVGRDRNGVTVRIKGYCPNCGWPFDFSDPQARTGQVIAGRYEVTRVLAVGGQGKTYLAHDRNLGADVVLKSLWGSVAKTAERERDALVGLRHDSIVRIMSYELVGPHPYLVLEYVPGAQLSARAADPLDVILAHGLQILQALDYLHARGLLHCDVNPANVMRFAEQTADGMRDRVRLIDFGAVRSLTKDVGPVSVYTAQYAPPSRSELTGLPDPERADSPTIGFDLFCLGRTLSELCHRQLRDRRAEPGVEALSRLLARATDIGRPKRRFVSARQFAEQLSGVIRQVVAAPPTSRRVSRASVLFGPMNEPLHGGLGLPRPVEHWVAARAAAPRTLEIDPPFVSPAPLEIAAALPTPLEDPDDNLPAADEVRPALAACRAELRRGSADQAEQALDRSGLPTWHWLHAWYSGLIALVRGSAANASKRFDAVRDMLPGELIPLLALGLCAESSKDLTVARLRYETVADTAPALGAAVFGLARVHLLAGRRAEAVEAADRLAGTLRFEREASIAAVRLLAAIPATSDGAAPIRPSAADLTQAQQRLVELGLDARTQTMVLIEIEYARYLLGAGGQDLSDMVREAAGHAATERDFVAMVDLANRLRPPIEWRLRGLPFRSRRAAHNEHVV
jgi:serine/threonine-protein kinase PknG